ncbi:hypothetical protein FJT64_009877 [Amphibalanus amphitrite]|uniref:PDZ domain-containing protein n=1 Tax=Amphibalanus amphitrite TaxID=1232801 RepID=A0A6A4VC42_AMPAM|nr:hypothetical protein FJT64_009877 [Amphibalanus amphitrite]
MDQQLSSLALLAEFGDRSDKVRWITGLLAEFGDRSDKSCADSMIEDSGAAYFLPEHYLPEPLTSQAELLRQLTEGHVTCGSEQPGAAGQAGGPAAAERRFVRVAAGCRGYGRHRCSVDLRVKSYSTSTLSIDPSCLRLSRCDPSGRSTTRTLHWSTVSKIEYKHRSRRLIVNTAGAEAMTFCGEKAKLRCLEYMLQQHLTSFREGLHLTAGSGQPTQVYRARADPTSPQLTHYCVRTPLSSLTNRAATRHAVAANQKAASPDLKAAPVSTANQKPAPAGSTNGRTPAVRRTNENAGSSPELTNQLEESPAAANRRRRSAGGPLRQRQVSRGAARWRSASQLAPGRPAAAARDGSPPANGIRMGTRVPVSALQRQKLRSREALPHLTDGAYVIAAGACRAAAARRLRHHRFVGFDVLHVRLDVDLVGDVVGDVGHHDGDDDSYDAHGSDVCPRGYRALPAALEGAGSVRGPTKHPPAAVSVIRLAEDCAAVAAPAAAAVRVSRLWTRWRRSVETYRLEERPLVREYLLLARHYTMETALGLSLDREPPDGSSCTLCSNTGVVTDTSADPVTAEVPATPDLTAQRGTRPVDGSTGDLRHTAGVFNITLHRCPRTGDLGVRVVRAAAAADGGLLTVETVTAAGPAGTRALIAGGDVITHISGCPLRPLSYSAAVDRLRRAVDPVTLTVIRRGDGGAASWTDSGAAKRPADEDAGDGDDVSRGSLEKRLCRDGPGRESVNDLVIGRLTRQLSGDCLATPEGKR